MTNPTTSTVDELMTELESTPDWRDEYGQVDGDALFPLLAMDKKAAVIASLHTVVPALIVGIALHFLWEPVFGFESFGFGVIRD